MIVKAYFNLKNYQMLDIDKKTILNVFEEAAEKWPSYPFLVVPKTHSTDIQEISYANALSKVKRYKKSFCKAGYSLGNRVAVLLGK